MFKQITCIVYDDFLKAMSNISGVPEWDIWEALATNNSAFDDRSVFEVYNPELQFRESMSSEIAATEMGQKIVQAAVKLFEGKGTVFII